MRVSLDGDHQILVGNPDIDRPIAETFALVEPLRAERPENPFGQPEGEAFRVIGGRRRDRLACFGRDAGGASRPSARDGEKRPAFGMGGAQIKSLARAYERPALRKPFAAFPADTKVA